MTTFDNSFNQAINADAPALVMFYKPDDPRCMQEMPRMKAAARELHNTAHLIEVDCNANPQLKDKYHIHAYPTFILFRDGQEAWRADGRIPYAELEAMVHQFQ